MGAELPGFAESPAGFYDDLAEHYHLIYPDWEKSMARQGDAVAGILDDAFEGDAATGRILDVSAGIGTQSIPLAARGFAVTARDISPRAIARLSREAANRGLAIDAAVADMRTVATSVHGAFDAVISLDNSVPHLPNDSEILSALRGFREVLRPGGLLLVSVRDYDEVDRTPESTHAYGERSEGSRTYRFRQEWTWTDVDHYRTTIVGEERSGDGWVEILRVSALYYAVTVARLLELMSEAGFDRCATSDALYQPLLVGRR